MIAQFEELEHDLFLNGFSDGYECSEPQHLEVPYLQGYARGAKGKISELLSQLELLTTNSNRYEQIYPTEQEF